MMKLFSISALVLSVLSLLIVTPAHAHVVVRPAEVVTAGFQTFTVSAPNERSVPYNTIKLSIPSGLKHVSPTVKTGWQINVEKSGAGEDATVTSITWSGNAVPGGFREDFTFSAQAPAEAGDLQWKAYQTYGGNETVAWDLTEAQQPKKADGSPDFSKSGPFSVTKVAKESAETATLKKTEQAAADAQKAADRGLYFGIAGVALGLTAIFLATRKK